MRDRQRVPALTYDETRIICFGSYLNNVLVVRDLDMLSLSVALSLALWCLHSLPTVDVSACMMDLVMLSLLSSVLPRHIHPSILQLAPRHLKPFHTVCLFVQPELGRNWHRTVFRFGFCRLLLVVGCAVLFHASFFFACLYRAVSKRVVPGGW